jgi:hypothetical protein
MTRKRTGVCHICGTDGPLSFEHVPPQSAYNSNKIWLARGDQLFQGRSIESLRKEQMQGGAGDYTLCARCNNDTGSWYGAAFVEWADQAVEILERAKGQPFLAYPYSIYPLRIIKQILAMFMSVNAPDFRKEVPDVVTFLLNRHVKGLPKDINLHAGYSVSMTSRTAGKSGLITGAGGSDMRAHAVSEIAFPPFIFVLTLASECPEPTLDLDHTAFGHLAGQGLRVAALAVLRFGEQPAVRHAGALILKAHERAHSRLQVAPDLVQQRGESRIVGSFGDVGAGRTHGAAFGEINLKGMRTHSANPSISTPSRSFS